MCYKQCGQQLDAQQTVEVWTTLPSSAKVKNEWIYTSTYSFDFIVYTVTM
jgi:hypothetical protein